MEIDVFKEKLSVALMNWKLTDEEIRDVIFHLTDWVDDFYSLQRVFESVDELLRKRSR